MYVDLDDGLNLSTDVCLDVDGYVSNDVDCSDNDSNVHPRYHR